MPLPRESRFEIYDPRRGQNFDMQTGPRTKLSSLPHQLLVVRFYPGQKVPSVGVPPSLAHAELENLVRHSIQAVGDLGFWSISPFTAWHRKDEALTQFDFEEDQQSLIGYFEPEPVKVETMLDLRRRYATYSEWVIGGCRGKFSTPTEAHWRESGTYWNINWFLDQIENLCIASLFNGETGEHIVLSRLYRNIDEVLEPLRAQQSY